MHTASVRSTVEITRRWMRYAVVATLLVAATISTPAFASTTPGYARNSLGLQVTVPVFAYYYLWWSRAHWEDMLGPNYPLTAAPLPLPATLDGNGCNPVSRFPGNHLTDVPDRIYSQDDPGFIEADVRQAAAAGLTGFAVNWSGTGSPTQTANELVYNRRLQAMVDAVHKVNAEGKPFSLWLSYKASAKTLSTNAIVGDLSYFSAKYGRDSAFDHSASVKPTMIWQGSRKYDVTVLNEVSSRFRNSIRIIGDEKTWTASRAAYLDGDAYYWSSQNPWSNPHSFDQLATLAATVRSSARNPDGSGKVWVAPAAPGYDSQLAGGSSCVPRRGGDTLRKLFEGNGRTAPSAWAVISWNEIAEGTYLDPMTRYGTTDLAALTSIIA
jgi:hypothetical protein